MSRRIALIATVALVATGLAVQAATATPKQHAKKTSSHLLVGINDEADALYGNTTVAFQDLTTLNAQVLRVNLYWGGNKWAVANKKPTDATDPGDPAYNWSLYDRLVRYAALSNIRVVFSILYTPKWENGANKNNAPKLAKDLQDFAFAAGVRYSGFYVPPEWQQDLSYGNGPTPLPAVTLWTAWNEPNNPAWLSPQYKKVGGKWRVESAFQYAKICNAVYTGIHSVLISPLKGKPVGETVACGVTGPNGNDLPVGKRSSVDPLSFLTAAHRYGMKHFDVYAHHPYANAGNESPTFVPKGKFARRIQLANLGTLIKLVTKYYGPKHFWLTEYGYQTNPPDKSIYGTSWKNQAAYMKQAYAIARKNPRIDMMLWFLVRDEPSLGGWQSGLETVAGKHKPAWAVFQQLPRG